jgi:hypothetical protein
MVTIADAIDRDALHIRHAFLEMPGLALTVAETARRHALSTAHAKVLLEALEAERFLVSGPDGVYRRSPVHPSRVKSSPPRTCFFPDPAHSICGSQTTWSDLSRVHPW